MTDAKPATIATIAKFFGGPLGQFKKEWDLLTDSDKEQIRQGFNDGTLTY